MVDLLSASVLAFPRRPLLLAALALGASLPAQARYEVFGTQCAGTGRVCGPVIGGVNVQGGTFANQSGVARRTYALPAKTTEAVEICGFEIFCHSASNSSRLLATALYADNTGVPGAVLATGSMLVGAQPIASWCKSTFVAPVTLGSGVSYWLAFGNSDPTIALPLLQSGETSASAYQDASTWVVVSQAAPWAFRTDRTAAAPACTGAITAANMLLPLMDTTLATDTDFAMPFESTGRGGYTCGLWMNTNSRGGLRSVQAFLCVDANGLPGQVVRTGTFELDSDTRLYRATWSSPYGITRGQRVWFGWSNPSPSINPNLSTGGQLLSYASKPRNSQTWQIASSGLPWNYILKMTDQTGDEPPTLTAMGAPKLGGKFDTRLSYAPASSVGILFSGSSDQVWNSLPLPFPFPNTYGCFVHTAWDGFGVGAATNGLGLAGVTFAVPNAQNLIGVRLYQQWLVIDPLANRYGLTFSNGGVAHVDV